MTLATLLPLARSSSRQGIYAVDGYIRVTIGSTCKRITSREECEKAAAQLGLLDTKASEKDVTDWPPYCFYEGESLYYNTNGNATSQCDPIMKTVCICKGGKGSF